MSDKKKKVNLKGNKKTQEKAMSNDITAICWGKWILLTLENLGNREKEEKISIC